MLPGLKRAVYLELEWCRNWARSLCWMGWMWGCVKGNSFSCGKGGASCRTSNFFVLHDSEFFLEKMGEFFDRVNEIW